jgi:4-hydroxythreonine-4-phosphate dehydrogenase
VARAVFLGGQALARDFAVARPRLGVCGLNPHAGEGGLFGDEEARLVAPGLEEGRRRLVALGIDVELGGPLVPDAAFRQMLDGRWDLVVALYHDQGLIPVKLAAFGHAVNVTLGLPFVRTSVDHGTGFDIAAKGVADETSFLAAMKLAVELASRPRA